MKKMEYPALAQTLYTTVLPNGLKIMVDKRPGFTKKLAYFATDYGAIHTRFTLNGEKKTAPEGVAHFLEHKLFEMPGRGDVTAEFAALGAVPNAFTSHDMTAYFFSSRENFESCLRLLLEYASTPYFTEESVEKERGIIDQEIGMNADSPESRVFENLMKAMYVNHPVRTDVLGSAGSIARITPQILYDCHRAFYTPGNMLLCVIGDVEPEAVSDLAQQVLGRQKRETAVKLRPWQEEMTAGKPSHSQCMEVAMPMFDIAFKSEPLDRGDAAIREEMVADLAAEVLFGESSPLYLRLYEEGIIDSSFGGGFETIDGCAMLLCSGDSDHPEAVRQALLDQVRKLLDQGIAQEDFLRLKRSALGRRIRSLDSFDATCFRVCAYHFADFDYFRFPEIYRDIDSGEILAFLGRVVRPERCTISTIYPKEVPHASC